MLWTVRPRYLLVSIFQHILVSAGVAISFLEESARGGEGSFGRKQDLDLASQTGLPGQKCKRLVGLTPSKGRAGDQLGS